MCDNPTTDCHFQRCPDCKGEKKISLRRLQIKPVNEVVLAVWESSDPVKKTVGADILIKEHRKCGALFIKHEHVLRVQRNVIWKEKSFLEQRQVVLPFTFAEKLED